MRKNRLARAVLALALAPAGAFADHSDGGSCGYANNQASHQDVGSNAVVYYDTNGGAGTTGSADEAAGVCTKGAPVNGSLEAGHSASKGWTWGLMPGSTQGGYIVVDGDKANPDPIDGYAGVSNYSYCSTSGSGPNEGPDDNCSATADDNTNGGGGVGAFGQGAAGSPIICGNTSGEAWDKTNRNGCYYP